MTEEKTPPSADPIKITNDQERRQVFLRYINRAWFMFGVVTLASMPIFPEHRNEFIFLIALIFPTYLLIRFLNLSGKTKLAGAIFTLSVNFGFYGLFMQFVRELGAYKAFETETTIWLLMGLAVLFAGALVDRRAAPILAAINSILLIGTRLTLAPDSAPRPSALVFWWMMALTIWLYEGTLQEALKRSQAEILERKQIEKNVLENENLLKESQIIANIGSYVMDVSSGIWKSSDMLNQIFGIDDKYEHTLNGWAALVHPDEQQTMIEYFTNEVIGKHGRFDKEYRIVRNKDQAERWVHGLGKLEINSDNQVVKMIGTIQDITERKRADEALRESEEKYRRLFDNANLGIFQSTPQGKAISVNNAFARMFGYESPEDAIKSIKNVATDLFVDPNRRAEILQLMADNPGLKTFENLYRRKDGTPFVGSLNTMPIKDSEGRLIRIEGIIEDITERKQAEEELHQRLTEQSILHQTSQSLLAARLDPETIYVTLHQAVSKIMPCEAFNIVLDDKNKGDYHAVYLYDSDERYPAQRIPHGKGLSGKVISNGETLFIHDNQQTDTAVVHYGSQRSVRSILAVPLRKNNESVGMISTQTYQPHAYNERHRVLLETLAAQVTTLIENARLFDAEKKQRQMSDALRDALSAGASMSASLDFETILDRLLETLERVLPFDGGSIMTVQKEKQKISITRMRGYKMLGKQATESLSNFSFDIKAVENLRWILYNKQPLVIPDIDQYPAWIRVPEDIIVRSWLGAPIIVDNEVIALFSLDSLETNFFTHEHLELLSAFTGQASLSLKNARLFDETAQRAQEFASLYETSNALNAENDLTTLLQVIIEHAVSLLNISTGAIYLYNESTQDLVSRVAVSTGIPVGLHLNLGEGVTGRVAQTKLPMRVDDYSNWEGRSPKFEGKIFRAVLNVPMLLGGKLIGVLAVNEMGESTRKFTDTDERLLSLFAAQAAGAIHSARLREETTRRAQEFASLYETSTALSAENDLSTLLKNIVEHAATLLNTANGFMYLVDRSKNNLEIVVATTPLIAMGTTLQFGEGAAGRVAQTLQPLRMDDYSTWEGRSLKYNTIAFRAILEVPMLFGGNLIGVLNVAEIGDSDRVYTESDEHLLSLFAAQAAGALHSARLREETARRAEEFASLYETSNALSVENELNNMLQVIVEHAKKLLDSASSGMYLYLPESAELELTVDTTPYILFGTRLKLNEGIAGRVAQTKQPLRIADYSTWEERSPLYEGTRIRAVLEVPMLYGGELIGVLTADEVGDSERKYTDADEHLLSLFASQAAGAIHSARLRQQTAQRLNQLQSLHTIDREISSSFELHPILNTVLSQTIIQLGVNAADILLFHPHLQTLEYAAGQGFRTHAIEKTQVRLGEGHAGQAAFDRRTIHIPNLPGTGSIFTRATMLEGEEFLEYYAVPLTAKGELKGVMEVFHRTTLQANSEWLNFLETLAGQAAIAIDQTQLFDDLQRANQELSIAYDATIEGWASAMDLRDKETENHTKRVTEMTMTLARVMGFDEKEMLHIRRGALLHDIGKMGIPDNILLKEGKLTDEEWVIMRQHPEYSHKMLQPIKYLQQSLDIPYCHHEKWDGTGYPRRLKGEEIPLAARIFSVIDVWDAVTIDRPYRKAWTKQKALKYIREQSGKHFEPRIVQIFLEQFDTRQ